MPTVKQANLDRQRNAWFIRQLVEKKETEARQRLAELDVEIPKLKAYWEEYQRLYNLHIKPLEASVNLYFNDLWEKRKLEHWLQGQAQHLEKVEADQQRPPNQTPGQRSWTLPPQVEKLPYADKSQVGHKPKKPKALTNDDAKELMAKIKALDPAKFDELLKSINGGK